MLVHACACLCMLVRACACLCVLVHTSLFPCFHLFIYLSPLSWACYFRTFYLLLRSLQVSVESTVVGDVDIDAVVMRVPVFLTDGAS